MPAFAQTFPASANLDRVIEEAIARDQIPGAVLLVGQDGQILHHKAYGSRALVPRREPMTLDTIFDCASLTKVVATTTSIMQLVEQGRVRLNDRVTEYLPEFQGGDSPITVRSLLTHFSGLRPDVDLKPEWSGYETGIRLALVDQPRHPPGARFVYSDINFVLLGEIVRRVTGKMLPDFARETIFQPLGMRDTTFQPPPAWKARIAPTEIVERGREPLRGVVHDPTTRFMGGVAGHAGLFSTADDLAKFARMMLNRGELNGVRVVQSRTVEAFTAPQTPPNQPVLRGFGWDIDSPFSGPRGELFPLGSFGHTGFTGTSMWIDPVTRTYVILMANSVHPRVRRNITPLRGKVATAVAAAIGIDAPGIRIAGYNDTVLGAGLVRTVERNARVLTGLDVLAEQKFAPLQGRNVGLVTNHTGLDREGKRNVDRMIEAGLKVVALYSPEHGIAGREDHENVGHDVDAATGLKIWSLYSGPNRRPSEEMLGGVDALVFDIQDIGARFYTYISTLGNVMEEAARHKIPVWVLDRPNPITGVHVQGPILDQDLTSFIGYFPMPVRHGMTVAEMARMFNDEKKIGADLQVVPMRHWERGDWFDSTGLTWIDPSPNMRSLTAAILYPGVAMLESSENYSVGRGTDTPFEVIGAAFVKGPELASYLNARKVPGVRFYPVRFTPSASRLQGRTVEGVRILLTQRDALDSARLGTEIAAALQALYPGQIDFSRNRRLIGSQRTIDALVSGEDPRAIHQSWQEDLSAFAALRQMYLLYQ